MFAFGTTFVRVAYVRWVPELDAFFCGTVFHPDLYDDVDELDEGG